MTPEEQKNTCKAASEIRAAGGYIIAPSICPSDFLLPGSCQSEYFSDGYYKGQFYFKIDFMNNPHVYAILTLLNQSTTIDYVSSGHFQLLVIT